MGEIANMLAPYVFDAMNLKLVKAQFLHSIELLAANIAIVAPSRDNMVDIFLHNKISKLSSRKFSKVFLEHFDIGFDAVVPVVKLPIIGGGESLCY